MAKLQVIDLEGSKVGDVAVSDDVFGVEIREHLLWEAVRHSRSARRAGTAKVKDRGEVHGTRAKMFKQKGTGNARHGSARVNVFRGGGNVHGPVPRDYTVGVNRRTMASALRTALSLRVRDGDMLVVKELSKPEVKTKVLAAALDKIEAPKALLVDTGDNKWLQLSARNLENAQFLDVRGLNVYDILRYPKLVISEASLKQLEKRLKKDKA